MASAEIKERLFRWIAVPALAAVLALLAVLQYRWSGQVSTAAKQQMQSRLQSSLLSFRQYVSRELASAGMEIKAALAGPSAINADQLKEQFSHWQQTAAHPNLVRHIYIWEGPGQQPPLRFDPARGQLERAPWPAEFASLERHLQEVSAMAAMHSERPQDGPGDQPGNRSPHFDRQRFPHDGRRRHAGPARGRMDFAFPWVVDQSAPALVNLARRRPDPKRAGSRAMTWLVIELNKSVLEKEIFPELAQKYFRGESGLDYRVVVRENGQNGERVLYASDAGPGADSNLQADAELNLFGPPFGRGAPEMGPEIFFAPFRAPGSERSGPQDDRRAQGFDRMPRFEVFRHSGEQSWQVVARHKSGSVEAAVNGLRRRNLMASFGVLIVLGVTMALIFIASQRARRLARLQMDFVAGVSHELRTPLAVIFSAAENIAHGVVEDKQQLVRYGNTIVKQTRQLTSLVEQVLQFAATQQVSRSYGTGPVEVSDIVDAALEGTAATVAAARFTVERAIEPGLPAVSADYTGLVQSLQNLITNAVKYGGEKRWLRVAARGIQQKGQVREIELRVEDRGIGISKEEIQHVFEPFYRSPAVTEAGIHGTGLGLPLARKVVEAMGGRLTAESELGQGSSFTIHLQTTEARGLEERRTAEKPAGAEPDFSA